ncbi:uncharacterized protein LOC111244516 isoform X2 [Varroa destructor]|uniref:Uncharacterized protein n=1 Tax=Varroa destructor TaxID=109461 RepID=A0A7M7J6E1_VARDE|nr:uncharacterized protein LOC111244516 isoform X2 [Varroa destructor]
MGYPLRVMLLCTWITCLFIVGVEAQFSKRRPHKEARQAACVVPSQWIDDWVQQGLRYPLRLDRNNFLARGKCLDSLGGSNDKEHSFVIDDTRDRCYRGFIIHEKHPNVLQYRVSPCFDASEARPDASSVRYQIESDLPTVLLIRVNATPERCPLVDQRYRFSYNRNHGECRTPPSSVDQCNQNNTRLMFRFQACAEVMGTESSTEELTCIARWKEGNQLYFIGKMVSTKELIRDPNDPAHYRCYMYQHDGHGKTIYLSESADATCYGVYSAYEGSRVMKLHIESPQPQCFFPFYMGENDQKRPVWRKIRRNAGAGDPRARVIFSTTSRELTISEDGEEDARAVCIFQMKDYNPDESNGTFSYVVEYQQKCEMSYRCLTLSRRSEHVVEMQIGSPAPTVKFACQQPYYDKESRHFDTLYRATPKRCILHGTSLKVIGRTVFPLEECKMVGPATTLGCVHKTSMAFYSTCGPYKSAKHFSCYGHYRRGNTTYMIVEEEGKGTQCFVYQLQEKFYTLSIYPHQCPHISQSHLRPGHLDHGIDMSSLGRGEHIGHEVEMRLQVLQGQSECDNTLDNASRAAMASSAGRLQPAVWYATRAFLLLFSLASRFWPLSALR